MTREKITDSIIARGKLKEYRVDLAREIAGIEEE